MFKANELFFFANILISIKRNGKMQKARLIIFLIHCIKSQQFFSVWTMNLEECKQYPQFTEHLIIIMLQFFYFFLVRTIFVPHLSLNIQSLLSHIFFPSFAVTISSCRQIIFNVEQLPACAPSSCIIQYSTTVRYSSIANICHYLHTFIQRMERYILIHLPK